MHAPEIAADDHPDPGAQPAAPPRSRARTYPWLTKLLAIGATVMLLSLALFRLDYLVAERQQYQREAIDSVQHMQAGAQTMVGPVLRRDCVETWEVITGEGSSRRPEARRHEHHLSATPTRLVVDAKTQTDLRYRGLFKVNGYTAKLDAQAVWADTTALVPKKEVVSSTLTCEPVRLWLAASDARGLRSASVTVGGKPLDVRPGTLEAKHAHGLHALLPAEGWAAGDGISAQMSVDLLGTQQLALVPAAQAVQWTLRSDWPHPSFGGRFLPNQRQVNDRGFTADWSLNALATSAPRDVAQGSASVCARDGATGPYSMKAGAAARAPNCLDTLSVAFVDPVNPYTLADRAIKYGLLFVLLTFTAVGLTEALANGRVPRVHPVQYALVGAALCLFFLLMLSLSEHLAFGIAYAIAAGACVLLLGVYARAMFGHRRDGVIFGAGMALLYGLLYVLLLREQTALVIGSIGLFAALAAVMLLTRRVDWYRLGAASSPATSRGRTA